MVAIECFDQESALRLRLAGRMTYQDGEQILEMNRRISSKDMPTVILDLEEVSFIDSTGIGMIVILADRARSVGGSLFVENPHGQVERILSLSKISDVIDDKRSPHNHPVWDDALITGHTEIDRQHKSMFARALYLRDTEKCESSQEMINDTLCALADYARDHFTLEEDLMHSMKYPHHREHIESHMIFFQRISELTAMHERRMVDVFFRTCGFVDEWLTSHIVTHDRKMADYLNGISRCYQLN